MDSRFTVVSGFISFTALVAVRSLLFPVIAIAGRSCLAAAARTGLATRITTTRFTAARPGIATRASATVGAGASTVPMAPSPTVAAVTAIAARTSVTTAGATFTPAAATEEGLRVTRADQRQTDCGDSKH